MIDSLDQITGPLIPEQIAQLTGYDVGAVEVVIAMRGEVAARHRPQYAPATCRRIVDQLIEQHGQGTAPRKEYQE